MFIVLQQTFIEHYFRGTVENSTTEKSDEKNPATKSLDKSDENTPVTKNDSVETGLRSKDIGNDSQLNAMNADRMVDETAAAPAAAGPIDTPNNAPHDAPVDAPVDTRTADIQPETEQQLQKEVKASTNIKKKSLGAASMDDSGASDSSSDSIGNSSYSDYLTLGSNRAQRKLKKHLKKQRKASMKSQSKANSPKGSPKQKSKGKGKGKGKGKSPKAVVDKLAGKSSKMSNRHTNQ